MTSILESSSRSNLFLKHDLFRKPVSTFRDHAPAADGGQLFFCRYFSWQPPQLSLSKGPQVDLKVSRSFTALSAAFESLPNLASRASKSALFSQIAGSAAVSPPVFELSGNSAGALAAESAKVAKMACALVRSNGASPLAMAAPALASSPFFFMSA